jgi:hypothetical protein
MSTIVFTEEFTTIEDANTSWANQSEQETSKREVLPIIDPATLEIEIFVPLKTKIRNFFAKLRLCKSNHWKKYSTPCSNCTNIIYAWSDWDFTTVKKFILANQPCAECRGEDTFIWPA